MDRAGRATDGRRNRQGETGTRRGVRCRKPSHAEAEHPKEWNWQEIKRLGLGELKLTPAEFWRYTPADLKHAARGASDQEQRAYKRMAWALAPVLSVLTGKRVTEKRLLGHGLHSREEKQQAWEGIKTKLEKRNIN